MFNEQVPLFTIVGKWFSRFLAGHFSVNDNQHEGCPKMAMDDKNGAAVMAAVDTDRRVTLEELE